MATWILQVEYLWSTIQEDCYDYVKKCVPCQKHGNITHARHEEMHHIYSPWSFAKWGMDILNPSPKGKDSQSF